MGNPESIPESMLITDYMGMNKLPEVDSIKIEGMDHSGWVVEYSKSGVTRHVELKGLMTTPDDLPIAVSYLGTGEEF